jgi:hypothetical protein
MAFPSSPTNNQTAVVNGITYTYNSTLHSWTRNTNANISSLSISGTSLFWGTANVANTTSSISSTTGALVVAGGTGVAGNLYLGGNLYVQSNATSATYTRIEYNIPHPFMLMGAS